MDARLLWLRFALFQKWRLLITVKTLTEKVGKNHLVFKTIATLSAISCLFVIVDDLRLRQQLHQIGLDVRLARDIIASFHDYHEQALNGNIPQSLKSLEKLCLPPGFGEQTNLLSPIIELNRNHEIRQVVRHLRKMSPKDLGDSPEAWIQSAENQ